MRTNALWLLGILAALALVGYWNRPDTEVFSWELSAGNSTCRVTLTRSGRGLLELEGTKSGFELNAAQVAEVERVLVDFRVMAWVNMEAPLKTSWVVGGRRSDWRGVSDPEWLYRLLRSPVGGRMAIAIEWVQRHTVESPESTQPLAGGCGQEILLEHAELDPVLAWLRYCHPRVLFTPHSTLNGFFLKGTKKEAMLIKTEMAGLDRP